MRLSNGQGNLLTKVIPTARTVWGISTITVKVWRRTMQRPSDGIVRLLIKEMNMECII